MKRSKKKVGVRKIADRKPRKIKSYGAHWERLANQTARRHVNLIACADCGRPVLDGYCCDWCGSARPQPTSEAERS